MAALRPRTTSVLIYHGDDLETLAGLTRAVTRAGRRLDDASAELDAARGSRVPPSDARYGDGDPEAEQAVADLEAARDRARTEFEADEAELDAETRRAAADALDVALQHIGTRAFRDLVAEHPARTEDDPDEGTRVVAADRQYGVNTATFPRALLAFVHPDHDDLRTITGPAEVVSRMDRFLDVEAADGDFERLWTTAYYLNRSQGADPKAARSSTPSPSGAST